jgi:ABC-2 type transport system ATP-binding protein
MTTEKQTVIEAHALAKRYGATQAVAGIDLAVAQGEILGLLGPNGSGKTTTILMLLGLTEPSAGQVRVLGFDPLRQPLEVKRVVGYLPDSVGFYDGLTARQNLAYTARLAGLRGAALDQRIAEALKQVELAGVARQRVSTFSRGMRQRLGLADILAKRARIAILDEPTAALDPHSTQEFLQLIRRLKHDGVTVLLSSHHLDQVQVVCDRVALFHRGRIALHGTVPQLARQVIGGGHVVELAARGKDVAARLKALPGVVRVTPQDANRFRIDADHDARADIARALAPHADILALGFAQPSLNEIYTRYFEGERHAA